ncbi:hypothetical protein BRADI_2g45526v3, partial [Brachypodium distachyon]
ISVLLLPIGPPVRPPPSIPRSSPTRKTSEEKCHRQPPQEKHPQSRDSIPHPRIHPISRRVPPPPSRPTRRSRRLPSSRRRASAHPLLCRRDLLWSRRMTPPPLPNPAQAVVARVAEPPISRNDSLKNPSMGSGSRLPSAPPGGAQAGAPRRRSSRRDSHGGGGRAGDARRGNAGADGGRTRGDAGGRVRQVGDVQGDRAAAEADRHRTASRAPRRTKVTEIDVG